MKTDAVNTLRVEPLWVRVDRNRVKLVVFVLLFVVGSAVLIGLALVAVPGSLIGVAGMLTGFILPAGVYFGGLMIVVALAIVALIALGALLAAVQLANAEDWVRNRFRGGDMAEGSAPWLESAVSDMSLAAGLSQPPRLLWLDVPTVNACAIGLARSRPVLGFTRGFFETFTQDEQRAVVATLVARVVAGDILFGTALAALMGPLRAIRNSHKNLGQVGEACGCAADGCATDGCDSCGCLFDALGDSDVGGGCAGAAGLAIFAALVAAVTWVAVTSAAWLVTAWGRALHRTAYEKADAEGMLLLKDPSPMLEALRKAITSSNQVADGDASYDGIFYAPTSGTPAVDAVERRRFDRLREVLSTEGLAARPL